MCPRCAGSNRTFMELKYGSLGKERLSLCVLIVPLWNWNESTHPQILGGGYVLIVPLWNWNGTEATECHRLNSVLIVPLWNWNNERAPLRGRAACSNRTFMELKLLGTYKVTQCFLVLIVPLWNWNYQTPAWKVSGQYRSNRTFMELK